MKSNKPAIPKYKQVKEKILQSIQNNEILPADKLPNEEEFAAVYGVSAITIRKALQELAGEGYIQRVKGKGSFVQERKQSTSNLIAMIFTAEDYMDVSYLHIIQGAQKRLSEYGYSMIVEWHDKDANSMQEVLQKHRELNVAGFLIYPYDPSNIQPHLEQLNHDGIPFVLLDRYNLEFPTHYAGCDNVDGGYMATKLLLDKGHSKIQFAGYYSFLSSEQERFYGFCSAMLKAGYSVSPDSMIGITDCDAIAKRVKRGDLTALVCCNDRMAYKMIENLAEQGIQVPRDISIVGFDDWVYHGSGQVGLTTIKQDFEQLGKLAVNLLKGVLENESKGVYVKVLSGVSVVLRDSISENINGG